MTAETRLAEEQKELERIQQDEAADAKKFQENAAKQERLRAELEAAAEEGANLNANATSREKRKQKHIENVEYFANQPTLKKQRLSKGTKKPDPHPMAEESGS